jgi:hypothetical protein
MRHSGFLMCLAAGLLFGMVTTAAADGGGGGGFWEKMSGPGKWAYGYGYFSLCLNGPKVTVENNKERCRYTSGLVWLNLGGSFATTGDESRRDLMSPDLKAYSFEPSVDFRVWPWPTQDVADRGPARALFVGVGAGVHHFRGEDVAFTRPSVSLRLSAIVYRHKEGTYLGVRYTLGAFLEGFTAEDFGDPVGSYSTNGADRAQTLSVFVHLGH